MDKTVRALGISLIIVQILNIVYLVMFFGNILNNPTQLNGKAVYYVSRPGVEDFLGFEAIMLGVSILLTILLVSYEVVFVETLKRIIRVDEVEGSGKP